MLGRGLLRLNLLKGRTASSLSAVNACSRPQLTANRRFNFASYFSANIERKPAQLCGTESDEKQSQGANDDTFKHLLNNSKFVRSIDPVGQVAEGEIIAVSKGKIYVDFGGKFHGVVPVPEENSERYVEGAKVTVLIKDLEMTDHFLGARRHISLLEAEIELVGLLEKPSS